MCVQIISNQNTLPKTKIALEKWWLGVGRLLFFWSLFSMGMLVFGNCIAEFYSIHPLLPGISVVKT